MTLWISVSFKLNYSYPSSIYIVSVKKTIVANKFQVLHAKYQLPFLSRNKNSNFSFCYCHFWTEFFNWITIKSYSGGRSAAFFFFSGGGTTSGVAWGSSFSLRRGIGKGSATVSFAFSFFNWGICQCKISYILTAGAKWFFPSSRINSGNLDLSSKSKVSNL